MTAEQASLIDTGGPDDNVSLDELAADADPRYRPSTELRAAVEEGGYGCLDRPVVPLLNALTARGLRTQESCAGGMLFVAGLEARAAAALEAGLRPWMQTRWSAWVEPEDGSRHSRTELWWSRRVPNWGGYMGTDADWRWRRATRSTAHVNRLLLRWAERLAAAELPEAGAASPEGAWVEALLTALAGEPGAVEGAEWFEVVLSRDSRGWSVLARRENEPAGVRDAATFEALRAGVDPQPACLLDGAGAAGYRELRAALRAATGGRRWSQLDAEGRRAMIAVYSIAPARHARAAVRR